MTNLLNDLDMDYAKFMAGNPNLDSNYYYYHDISINNSYSNTSFVLLKQSNIRYIVIDGIDKVKLYLSDADIIDILVKIDLSLFELMMDALLLLYTGEGEDFIFTINGQTYKSLGLKFSSMDKKLKFNSQIETDADFNINFEDLVNLINLILAKEFFANEMNTALTFNRTLRQIAKFVSLARFYRNKEENTINFLNEITYDTTKENINNVYKYRTKKIDMKFNNTKLFEKYYINGKILTGNPRKA
jgi:hypothetical protein